MTAWSIDEPALLSSEEWKHLELLHSRHSLLCSFVLQVGRRLLFWFFLEYTLLCKQTWNSCDTFLSGDTVRVFNCLRPCMAHFAREICKRRFYFEDASIVFRPHYAGEVGKRRFHSENASSIFRSHYTGEIWKRNNHQSFWICV